MLFTRVLACTSFLWLNVACSGGLFSGNTNAGGTGGASKGNRGTQGQEADNGWNSILESTNVEAAEKNRDFIEEHFGNDTIELEGFEFANLLDIAEDNLRDFQSSPDGDLTVAERFEKMGLDPYNRESPTSDEFEEAMQTMSDLSLSYSTVVADYEADLAFKLQDVSYQPKDVPCKTSDPKNGAWGAELGEKARVMGLIEMTSKDPGIAAAASAINERTTLNRGTNWANGCPNMDPSQF